MSISLIFLVALGNYSTEPKGRVPMGTARSLWRRAECGVDACGPASSRQQSSRPASWCSTARRWRFCTAGLLPFQFLRNIWLRQQPAGRLCGPLGYMGLGADVCVIFWLSAPLDSGSRVSAELIGGQATSAAKLSAFDPPWIGHLLC